MRKSSIRSWNWPCMSPHTVTGHFCLDRQWAGNSDRRRVTTYHWLHIRFLLQHFSCLQCQKFINSDPSGAKQRSKPTRSHSRRTSSSANCLHVIKLSIQPSSVGMDPGSLVGERWCGSGDREVSISMLLSMVGTAGVNREEGPAGGRGGLVRNEH